MNNIIEYINKELEKKESLDDIFQEVKLKELILENIFDGYFLDKRKNQYIKRTEFMVNGSKYRAKYFLHVGEGLERGDPEDIEKFQEFIKNIDSI